MLLLDVNVVLAAYRGDHPDHPAVRRWFEAMLAAGERFCVPATVWASFLRLVTNRRIFTLPATIEQAFGFAEATCAQSAHLTIGPGARHLAILRRLCDEADIAGDLVPDAVLAAIALEHGAEVVTLDRDFARFTSVSHRSPLAW